MILPQKVILKNLRKSEFISHWQQIFAYSKIRLKYFAFLIPYLPHDMDQVKCKYGKHPYLGYVIQRMLRNIPHPNTDGHVRALASNLNLSEN